MTPALTKVIRKIEIQTTRLAKDMFAGLYRSAFKGQGIEFEEVREYQPGDDVDNIDWPVTSHMQRPYIKIFREERDLTVLLLIDASASTRFGSTELKSQLIAEIGALLAFSAIKNNDRVGLMLFTEEVEKYIPPKRSVRHVLRVIRELLAFTPQRKGTNISKALSFLGKVQSKSNVCFLISDFICPDYSKEAALIALQQDLIAISVSDPLEERFPNIQLADLEDLENGTEGLIDTTSSAFQESYPAKMNERLLLQQKLMAKVGGGFVDIRTDRPYLPILRKFFKLRSKRPK